MIQVTQSERIEQITRTHTWRRTSVGSSIRIEEYAPSGEALAEVFEGDGLLDEFLHLVGHVEHDVRVEVATCARRVSMLLLTDTSASTGELLLHAIVHGKRAVVPDLMPHRRVTQAVWWR
jgi:hypothetical protein